MSEVKKEPFKPSLSKVNTSIVSTTKTQKNRSLIDSTNQQIFQLSQQSIQFINTEVNELYEIAFTVRNVSQNSQTIKIRKPSSAFLSVKCNKECSVAAGLDFKITVILDNKENISLTDKIVITSENFEIEVPILVHPELGKIQYEPFINFGFVKTNSSKSIQWKIVNTSDIPTHLQLKPYLLDQNATIQLNPQNCVIPPRASQIITISLTSNVSQNIEGTIEIQPKALSVCSVEFVANFCEFSRIFADQEGNEMTEINLPESFAGETQKISGFLVNNAPRACQYRITRKKGFTGEETCSLMTPAELGRDDTEKLIQYSPTNGELQAYESVQFTASVQAKFDENDLQLFCNYISGKIRELPPPREWLYTLKALMNHEDQQIYLNIKGTSFIPQIALSSTYFIFGNCFLKTKHQQNLLIHNHSHQQLRIQFQKSSNYNFNPIQIAIQPQSHVNVTVIFHPKIVGDLNQFCCMTLGQFEFPIKMLGKGVFGKSKFNNELETLRSTEEMLVDGLDQTQIQNEISRIKEDTFKRQYSNFNNSNEQSILHFDTYRHPTNQNSIISEKSFFLTDQTNKNRVLRNKNGKEVKVDLNNLNPNVLAEHYPFNIKNPQEQKLVNRQLSSVELQNISVGPVKIDIGSIFLRSSQRKTFHICNFNSKPIQIKLDANHPSFSETSEQRQMLPGECSGGFNFVFEALAEGVFKHTLQYVINGCHFFEFLVSGTCIQPTVTLSRTEIKFLANDEDKDFIKKETIQLTNSYDYDLQYQWKLQKDSLFKIQPTSGLIKPRTCLNVVVSHNFEDLQEISNKIQETLKLKIKYGKTVEVKLSSFISECSCICKSQEINFKEISIGKMNQQKIQLKNLSKNTTLYKIISDKELDGIMSVSPKSGVLHGEEIIEISFKMLASKSTLIDSLISIIIRGNKVINIPLKANIIMPKIRIENQEIDFGSTPVEGNPACRVVTLINDSTIPIDLEFRLAKDTFLANSLALLKRLDQNLIILDSKDNKNSKVTYLRMSAKSKSSFVLEFSPETTEDYEFYLPLFILNSNDCLDELQKNCRCKGIKNRLIANQKEINFGKIVIEQPEHPYNKSQILELRNPQEEPIEWWIEETNNISPFRLEKNKGRLEGFQKINLKIFFFAENAGEYLKQLQFFIDQAEVDISRFYMKVGLKATACYPTLYFDQPYLILPVVNLNEESSAILQINNGGYENINLKHTVVQEFSNIDLKIKYLNGSNLGVTKKQVKVEISFLSEKPISFTVKVNFYDHNNRFFTINVSGTADNCLYTHFEEVDQPNLEKETLRSADFLKYYINNRAYLTDQVIDFPRSFIENQFDLFNCFISLYSSNFEKIKANNKKIFKRFSSFQYMSQVIKVLKSEGAFLNHIRPEMLLNYDEYVENLKIRAEGNLNAFNFYKFSSQQAFDIEQKKSWIILMFQIFKIYSRVNPGKLKNNAEYWVKFTSREKVLLSWLQKTYQLESGIDLSSKSSLILSSINNGEVLSALISKYTNIKMFEEGNKNVKNFKEKEKRCKAIIEVFNQIGINPLCRVEDLMKNSPKEILLIIQNLYLILPSYLQKGEPIVFSCSFGQIITKSIEITNPSKHPITYLAKIQGSKAYQVQSDVEFTIQSKKTHEVKIKYISNININNSTATLTLTGKASGKFTPSTFIFVLKNVILGRISQKNIQINGNIYEQLQFPLKVTNNFNQDGEFKVQLVNSSKSQLNSFFLFGNTLKIKKGEASTLNMTFLPFVLETQQCQLIFRDEKVGEFQYEINGVVENNSMSQEILRIPQTLYTNKKYTIDLSIPTKNDLLMRARRNLEYLVEKFERKNTAQKDVKSLAVQTYQKFYSKLPTNQTFSLKLSPASSSIVLKNQSIIIKDIESNDESIKRQDQKISFEITLKTAIREGSFFVSLKNASGTDLRRYKIVVNSVAKPLKYELEMKTPANKTIVQPLPLINVSSQINNFLVTLVTNQSSKIAYSIDYQKGVQVQPKAQKLVHLTFKPKNQLTYTALLKVQNTTTGQNIEYEIIGIAEEPETELIVFDQEVRKEKSYSIKMTTTKATRCNVLSFSLSNVQYSKNFVISNQNSFFKFKFLPKLSGKYEGKLVIEQEQKLHAFKILITVRNTIEGEIKMRTVERKGVSAMVPLEKGTYTVSSEDSNLTFEPQAVVDEDNGVFPIQYYSSKPEEKQSLITFTSESHGEITFLIKVIVEAMPEIKLEPFQVELGKRQVETIILENTDDQPMNVIGKCSHPTIFSFEPEHIVVPAKSKQKVDIIYKASSLELEQGKISFNSDNNSKWQYHLSGYGLPQTKPELKVITAQMNQQTCQSINFVNPFSKSIQVMVSFENMSQDNAFTILLKNSKIDLEPYQQLQIPVAIEPKSVALNFAVVKVMINERLFWKYELQAKTIYHSTQQVKVFKVPARIKQQHTVTFNLVSHSAANLENKKLIISSVSEGQSHFLRNTVKVVSEGAVNANNEIAYTLELLSYRPKNVMAQMEVCSESGCKWIYKYQFCFLAPPADDHFEIIASINKPSSVQFKLTNTVKSYAKFSAYFTSDSGIQFSVSPKHGELEPYGREGSVMEVSFCPTQYRNSWKGKLIIESEDSYWSYDVKGSLPHYSPPVGKSTIRN